MIVTWMIIVKTLIRAMITEIVMLTNNEDNDSVEDGNGDEYII